MTVTLQTCPFDVIPGRRYVKVAEWLGGRDSGQRTARWFHDLQTGSWYLAESWKRPNLRRRLTAEQVLDVQRRIAGAPTVRR